MPGQDSQAPRAAKDSRNLPPDLIAEVLKKSAEQKAWKPVFVSKKERQRLAEEKLSQEKLAKEAEERQQGKLGSTQLKNGVRGQETHRVPTGPRAMQNSKSHESDRPEPVHGGNHRANGKHGPDDDVDAWRRRVEQAEEEERRARYMGPPVNKFSNFSAKKKRRYRGKFNFDWDPDDDTSRPPPRDAEASSGRDLLSIPRDDWTDEQVQRKADILRRSDPEFGQERAQKLLEQYRAIKEEKERKTRKDRHWSEKALEEMTPRDWRIFKENFGIATKGGAIPNPMRSWDESGLPARLLNIVFGIGYKDPTPIQMAAIPIALKARDLIGVAATGSGKTATYLLPMLEYISDLPPLAEFNKNDGPYALILAPTRELAQQIQAEANKFATPLGLTVVSIVGGHALEEQAFALRNGAEIIVATPGRLVDCIERRLLVFSQCCYVILDEADRMIDQGFEEHLTRILDALPVSNEKPDSDAATSQQLMTKWLGGKERYRQTMMYTATMPPAVEKIATKYLRRPAIVTIGNVGEAVDTVEQRVEFLGGEEKRKKRLQEIFNSGQFKPPIIVFVNIKRNCDAVAKDIKGMGYSAVTLHGSKTQEQREAALASLRNGQTEILVATDLAGRGIDVPDVSLVLNFNMANNIESYTHRIGRTGRAGKSGVAITFLGDEDKDVLYDLKQIISKSSVSKLPDELKRHPNAMTKPATRFRD